MGIQSGFSTYFWEQITAAKVPWGSQVDLAAVGAKCGVLIVDGNNVMQRLYDASDLDGVFGGQAAAFEAMVQTWARDLMRHGVELWVVFDGIGHAMKHECVLDQGMSRIEARDTVIAGCLVGTFASNRIIPEDVVHLAKRAFLRLVQLEREKAHPMLQVHFALEEANTLAVDLFRRKANAVGILSGDLDFLFYEGCKWLPMRLFDLKNGTARVLDGPTVAEQMQLPLAVFPLLPGLAGHAFLSYKTIALRKLQLRLVKRCYRNGIPPGLTITRARLLAVLHFLRPRRPKMVLQAVGNMVPDWGAFLIDRIQSLARSYAAKDVALEEDYSVDPLERVVSDWEERLSDAETESEPGQLTPREAPFSVMAHPPFPFQYVDLPQPLLNRLVTGLLKEGRSAALIALLERRRYTTVPILEVPEKSATPECALSRLSCADAKLALLRQVLYGLVFEPGVTVQEVVRAPDGLVEVSAAALRGPGLPSAEMLQRWRDPEARWRPARALERGKWDPASRSCPPHCAAGRRCWQWLTTVLLGLPPTIPLRATDPAPLALAAFFMVCTHYPVPAHVAEAWLCAILCPRQEGSSEADVHPRLGLVPGPRERLLQGFTAHHAALPALHAHYLRHLELFAGALDLECPDELYFDSVVYRCLLADPSLAPTLPWHADVQRWLLLLPDAVDYHIGLRERLIPEEYDAALEDVIAQQEAGWARVQAAEVPIIGTVIGVHRGEKPFALVRFRPRANAEARTCKIWEWDFSGVATLVSGTSMTFRLRNNSLVGLQKSTNYW
eukprot:EG_transcript_1777